MRFDEHYQLGKKMFTLDYAALWFMRILWLGIGLFTGWLIWR